MRELCRKIRNAFAHGESDACRELVAQASLAKAFAAVAGLPERIEAPQRVLHEIICEKISTM